MLKEDQFKSDYYRMTGQVFTYTVKSILNILKYHNLKYMWWWRKKESSFLKIIAKFQLYRYSRKYGIEIGNAKIGKGFYIGQPYNITINGEAVIGNNVNIHKGATIGFENRGVRRGAPNIGDNVYIGVNATIVGKINIGSDVLIAANSFVNFDVPSHSIVIGNPGQVIYKENATDSYVNFCV